MQGASMDPLKKSAIQRFKNSTTACQDDAKLNLQERENHFCGVWQQDGSVLKWRLTPYNQSQVEH